MFDLKVGDWVQYKDHIAQVHTTSHKAPYRVCIEWETLHHDGVFIKRDWVHRSAIKPLDVAVNDLLRSINN